MRRQLKWNPTTNLGLCMDDKGGRYTGRTYELKGTTTLIR